MTEVLSLHENYIKKGGVHMKLSFDMIDEMSDILTFSEVCTFLKIGKNLGYELIHSQELKAKKVGRSYRVYRDDLKNYLQTK